MELNNNYIILCLLANMSSTINVQIREEQERNNIQLERLLQLQTKTEFDLLPVSHDRSS